MNSTVSSGSPSILGATTVDSPKLAEPVVHSESNMLKNLLLTSSIALSLAIALPTQAQTPPAETEPVLPESTQAAELSEAELEQFASVVGRLQAIQENTRTESIEVIEDEGLSRERFNEILQAQQNPQAQPETEITDEELSSFQSALLVVADIQEEARSQMQAAITEEGMPVTRFNEILAMVQQDPSLQEEVQRILEQ